MIIGDRWWYVLKIYRPKYIDSKYIDSKYIDSKYIDNNISKYMQNVFIFLNPASTRFRFYEKVRKSTKKYEGDLGLGGRGEAII